jgi:hypothetical protein
MSNQQDREHGRARTEDYWEQYNQETVAEHIQANSGDWDVLAIVAAGTDESTLFCTVVRRKVSDDGSLILSERYYRYDSEQQSGGWLQNGIERRVTGHLATALKVVYSALENGDLNPDNPMLVDSRDGLDYNPDSLTEQVEQERDDRDESTPEKSVTDPEVCMKCEQPASKENMSCMSGDLGDIWVHQDGCPEPEQEADAQ